MMFTHHGPYADNAICSAVPYNDGAGIRMGLEVGGRMTKGTGGSYGREVLAYPRLPYDVYGDPLKAIADYEAMDKTELRDYLVCLAPLDGLKIHLNLDGRRFYDEGFGKTLVPESTTYVGYMNDNAIMSQPYATAFAVFDGKVAEAAGGDTGGNTDMRPILDMLKGKGGLIAEGDTLEACFRDLNAKMPKNHQLPVLTALNTVQEFNAALLGGDDALAALEPARTPTGMQPIDTPPFYAIPITAGVMGTFGGLSIDTSCAVLQRGTFQPIEGLWAVPFAAGGNYYYGYNSSSLAIQHSMGFVAGNSIVSTLA
jgi:hypothetical protein